MGMGGMTGCRGMSGIVDYHPKSHVPGLKSTNSTFYDMFHSQTINTTPDPDTCSKCQNSMNIGTHDIANAVQVDQPVTNLPSEGSTSYSTNTEWLNTANAQIFEPRTGFFSAIVAYKITGTLARFLVATKTSAAGTTPGWAFYSLSGGISAYVTGTGNNSVNYFIPFVTNDGAWHTFGFCYDRSLSDPLRIFHDGAVEAAPTKVVNQNMTAQDVNSSQKFNVGTSAAQTLKYIGDLGCLLTTKQYLEDGDMRELHSFFINRGLS